MNYFKKFLIVLSVSMMFVSVNSIKSMEIGRLQDPRLIRQLKLFFKFIADQGKTTPQYRHFGLALIGAINQIRDKNSLLSRDQREAALIKLDLMLHRTIDLYNQMPALRCLNSLKSRFLREILRVEYVQNLTEFDFWMKFQKNVQVDGFDDFSSAFFVSDNFVFEAATVTMSIADELKEICDACGMYGVLDDLSDWKKSYQLFILQSKKEVVQKTISAFYDDCFEAFTAAKQGDQYRLTVIKEKMERGDMISLDDLLENIRRENN